MLKRISEFFKLMLMQFYAAKLSRSKSNNWWTVEKLVKGFVYYVYLHTRQISVTEEERAFRFKQLYEDVYQTGMTIPADKQWRLWVLIRKRLILLMFPYVSGRAGINEYLRFFFDLRSEPRIYNQIIEMNLNAHQLMAMQNYFTHVRKVLEVCPDPYDVVRIVDHMLKFNYSKDLQNLFAKNN